MSICLGFTEGSLGGPYQGGYGDAWVAKYSADGALLWKRQLGTSELDLSGGVATDGEGNVYISGLTGGSLGGPSRGGFDAFVAKYSADGALLWTGQLGSDDNDGSGSVATDAEGNVYLSGFTNGSLGGPSRGGSDAWVAKYSAGGALRWKRQLGTPQDDSGSVATDAEGNVCLSGFTNGSLGGPSRGGSDAWVAKYSAGGALRWKRQLGTPQDDSGSVATDAEGNVYLSGFTEGSLGGPYRGGRGDAWVAKYSAGGALRWKRQLGTSEQDWSAGVATDDDGNIYISGKTGGSLGGASEGIDDAFVAKYFTRR